MAAGATAAEGTDGNLPVGTDTAAGPDAPARPLHAASRLLRDGIPAGRGTPD